MKLRLDFARILPGLLLVLAGMVLIAVLLIVAIGAFLLSFMPGFGGVVTVALQLMLVPAVLIAAGIVTVVTGTSWRSEAGGGWFEGWAWRRALKDRLRIGERVGEVFGIVIAAIVFLFLYGNQLQGAAFFSQSFGGLAQFFFYAPLFTGVVLSVARAVYGRRNAIRPLDCLNMLFLAVAAFWLLSAFPFEFSRLGEMFPSSIQFVFAWLNNDIGRILLAFAGVVSLANAAYTAILYSAVRGQLGGGHSAGSTLR